MSKYISVSLAVFFYLLSGPILASDLKLIASPWPPYVGTNLLKNGVAVHIVTEALSRAGYNSNLALVNWPDDLEAAKSGEHDVIAAVWYSEERTESLAFSEPYLINSTHFFKHSDSEHKFKSLADLDGLKIGVVEEYAYGETFSKASEFIQVIHETVFDSLTSLVAREVDLVLADSRVSLYELNTNIPSGVKQVTMLGIPYATKSLRIGVSKHHTDHERIINKFNLAIAAMKEDGSYTQIFATHRVNAIE